MKIGEAAVVLGLVAVAAVSFLDPVIIENGNSYEILLRLDKGYTERIDELVDNSVHLGVEYTGAIYRTDNTRKTFTITKSVLFQSLHDRYVLKTEDLTGERERYTTDKKEVIAHLLSLDLTADKERAYSCVANARIRVFNIDSAELEGQLWNRQQPGTTFYFDRQ